MPGPGIENMGSVVHCAKEILLCYLIPQVENVESVKVIHFRVISVGSLFDIIVTFSSYLFQLPGDRHILSTEDKRDQSQQS